MMPITHYHGWSPNRNRISQKSYFTSPSGSLDRNPIYYLEFIYLFFSQINMIRRFWERKGGKMECRKELVQQHLLDDDPLLVWSNERLFVCRIPPFRKRTTTAVSPIRRDYSSRPKKIKGEPLVHFFSFLFSKNRHGNNKTIMSQQTIPND